MHETLENIHNTPEKRKMKNIFEIDPEIKQFGGVQKFVLLKLDGDYLLGSFANLNHSEILQEMNVIDGYEILGGGLFSFYNDTITIDTSFLSSKLGPINMKKIDLKTVMQNIVGNQYKVELSE